MLVIRKAAVLGAGRMGTAVAAHLANAGIPTLLLDLAPTELTEEEKKKRPRLSSTRACATAWPSAGIATAAKGRPGAFAHPSRVDLLTPGNFEDDLPKLADVDWVVEAVVERLDIKQDLLGRVAKHVGPQDHRLHQLLGPLGQRHGGGAARRGASAASWAPTSSSRRGTCICSSSSPARAPTRRWWTGCRSSPSCAWARAWS